MDNLNKTIEQHGLDDTGFSDKDFHNEHKKSLIDSALNNFKEFNSKKNGDEFSFEFLYAEHIKREDSVRHYDGNYYRWKNGFWNICDNREELALATKFIDERDPSKSNPRRAKSMVEHYCNQVKSLVIDEKKIIIPLKNAYLIYDNEMETFKVERQHKKYGVRHQINVNAPETEKIMKHNDFCGYEPNFGFYYSFDEIKSGGYLEHYFSKSLNDFDKRKTVQQFVGYTLQHNLELRKMLWCYGMGKNGKTVLQNLTSKLHHKTASINLKKLSGFGLQGIIGASLITCPEAPSKGIDEEALKSLCSDDNVFVEIKNKDNITMKNKAKMMFNINQLVKFEDSSNGLSSRCIFVEFDEINEKDVIVGITDLIEEQELKSLLDWALIGLIEVIKTKKIHECENSKELKEEVFYEYNSVVNFINDKKFVADNEARGIEKSALHAEYEEWCNNRKIPPFGLTRFCGVLKSKFNFPESKKKLACEDKRKAFYMIRRK
nr:DUF5906 domain-containing protein [uncultured Pseudogulbenkiania sp.]